MSVEEVIKNFSSRFIATREPAGNLRGHVMPSGSRSSHSSDRYWQALEEFKKLYPPTIMGYELKDILCCVDPNEYEELKNQELLNVVAKWLYDERLMMQGIAPPQYIKHAVCRGCGPIFIFESSPVYVLGCPWCHVRAKGLKVPRPKLKGV